jgi:hypothetical protein
MLLADEFLEGAWPHAHRERLDGFASLLPLRGPKVAHEQILLMLGIGGVSENADWSAVSLPRWRFLGDMIDHSRHNERMTIATCGPAGFPAEPPVAGGLQSIMCGIVAYIGTKPALPILLEGLKRLEYRGYDSAGIAVLNGKVTVAKSVGRVRVL